MTRPTRQETTGMLTPGIAYGADFNPEQWDDSYLDADIALMLEARVNTVTVGVFSWAVLEPRPGEYHFDWLRRVMNRLHAAGIGVDLATGTASPPPWLGALHPSTLPVTRDGITLMWGGRQQVNPGSAVLRDRIAALVRRLAAEFAHHPALVAWHVNNEYGCHVSESFDEESAARFRVWLERRHGSLDALNAAWGTTFWSQRFSTWDEVIPPRPSPAIPNPHHLDDWRAFCSDTLLELYLLERDILRQANPDVPITTNYMGLFRPVDYWKWSKHVDFVSNDSYPDPANPRAAREFAFDCDLMRSLGGGRPFIQMEQVTSGVQWRPRNAVKRPGQYELWSMLAVARGADGILNFQWRQSLTGSEAFHGAMVQHAGTESRVWEEVVGLGTTLAELDAVRGTAMRAKIAIVWDWRNAWAQQHAVGPTDEDAPENGARAWHASLYERGHLVDFVHPDNDLAEYDLVIVPSLFRLTETHAQRLRDAHEAGTHLLVTYLTGYVDANGHAIPGGYLLPIADILGVRVTDASPRAVQPVVLGHGGPLHPTVDRISAAVSAPAADQTVGLRDLRDQEPWPGHGLGWAERVVVDDPAVAVVAAFQVPDVADGPAITVRRAVSGGSAWYVATDLDAVARDRLLDEILPITGVHETQGLPAGVEHVARGDVAFYLNHGDRPVTVPHSPVPPAAGGDVIDVVVGPRQAIVVDPGSFVVTAPTVSGSTTAAADTKTLADSTAP